MQAAIARAANGLAVLAGLALLALVAMTAISSLGALGLKGAQAGWLPGALGLGPYKAGFELVELTLPGIVYAMLPLVQLRHAHARVALLRGPIAGLLDRIWQGLAALLFGIVAWRIGVGMAGKMGSGETTFLLGLPLWWGYAACLPGAWGAALVALWTAAHGEHARE